MSESDRPCCRRILPAQGPRHERLPSSSAGRTGWRLCPCRQSPKLRLACPLPLGLSWLSAARIRGVAPSHLVKSWLLPALVTAESLARVCLQCPCKDCTPEVLQSKMLQCLDSWQTPRRRHEDGTLYMRRDLLCSLTGVAKSLRFRVLYFCSEQRNCCSMRPSAVLMRYLQVRLSSHIKMDDGCSVPSTMTPGRN